MRRFYVYILASRSRQLYIGVTNDIVRRVHEHRKERRGFTGKYRVERLVYLESSTDVRAALAREKQVKGWRRSRKIALIASTNPGWDDLAEDWYDRVSADPSLRSG